MTRRTFFSFLLALPLATAISGSTIRAAADVSVDDLLRDMRKALGGESAAAKVNSLACEGTFRRVFGTREMSGDVEIALAFPDRYIRTESFSPNQDPGNRVIRTMGFAQEESLDGVTGGGGGFMMRFGGPGGGPGQASTADGRTVNEERLARLRRMHRTEASRLMLALLGRADAMGPLTLTYAGVAESPDGRAHVVEGVIDGGTPFRLFVDETSHMPLMMTYREPAPRIMQAGPGQGGPPPTPEERERRMREMQERAAQEPPRMQDVEVFFSDHRKVSGLMLPHVIRRVVDGNVVEETTLTKFVVNPSFKAETFKKR